MTAEGNETETNENKATQIHIYIYISKSKATQMRCDTMHMYIIYMNMEKGYVLVFRLIFIEEYLVKVGFFIVMTPKFSSI